jgi:iron(II)-dependent oxidoreductase
MREEGVIMLELLSSWLEMVHVPEGVFRMGANADAPCVNGEEVPEHSVWLAEYEIMKTPVTMGIMRAYAREQPESAYARWLNEAPVSATSLRDDHAAVWTSWHDAHDVAQWLSRLTGDKWDLPTEAQWEKACRGTVSRIFPWGNKWLSITEEQEVWDPGPVARHPNRSSPYGCLDMWENVLEWCLDWWCEERQNHERDILADSEGPSNGLFKMCRGGNSSLGKPQCCYRREFYWEPSTRNSFTGFRLVRMAIGNKD